MEALKCMDYPIGNNPKKYTVEEVSQMESHAELVGGYLFPNRRAGILDC